MNSIKPLGARILVRRVDAEEKSSGGIIIPDTAKEKAQEAQVVALGTGGKDDEGNPIIFNVKEGDRVLLSKWGGTEIKLNGEDVVIVQQNDILAVFSK